MREFALGLKPGSRQRFRDNWDERVPRGRVGMLSWKWSCRVGEGVVVRMGAGGRPGFRAGLWGLGTLSVTTALPASPEGSISLSLQVWRLARK